MIVIYSFDDNGLEIELWIVFLVFVYYVMNLWLELVFMDIPSGGF